MLLRLLAWIETLRDPLFAMLSFVPDTLVSGHVQYHDAFFFLLFCGSVHLMLYNSISYNSNKKIVNSKHEDVVLSLDQVSLYPQKNKIKKKTAKGIAHNPSGIDTVLGIGLDFHIHILYSTNNVLTQATPDLQSGIAPTYSILHVDTIQDTVM